jgi:AAA family ATP:ADP antiporter
VGRFRDAVAEAREAFRESPRDLGVLIAAAVAIMASYGFARPAAESLFIGDYGAEALPWAWLGVAAAAILVTAIYNRFAASMPLARLWPRATLIAAGLGVGLLGAELAGVRHASFALYIWKDIYIVVLVELFWSVANVSYPIERARWAYGLFLAAGSAASMAAELAVGPLAGAVGTDWSLLAIAPLLAVAALLGAFLPGPARQLPPTPSAPPLATALLRGAKILARSRYLTILVLLICAIQIAVNLIDYQYNAALEIYSADDDVRTDIAGKIYAATNAAALILQLLAGPLLKLAGVPLILVAIPGVLIAGVLWAAAASPRLFAVGVVKVLSKALDYSLGRAAKEILYIPLSYVEKTEGKALVDLLTYRVAKGLASGMLLWLAATGLGAAAIAPVVLAMLGAWLVLAAIIGRRFSR